jgi:hypothetical protein
LQSKAKPFSLKRHPRDKNGIPFRSEEVMRPFLRHGISEHVSFSRRLSMVPRFKQTVSWTAASMELRIMPALDQAAAGTPMSV